MQSELLAAAVKSVLFFLRVKAVLQKVVPVPCTQFATLVPGNGRNLFERYHGQQFRKQLNVHSRNLIYENDVRSPAAGAVDALPLFAPGQTGNGGSFCRYTICRLAGQRTALHQRLRTQLM